MHPALLLILLVALFTLSRTVSIVTCPVDCDRTPNVEAEVYACLDAQAAICRVDIDTNHNSVTICHTDWTVELIVKLTGTCDIYTLIVPNVATVMYIGPATIVVSNNIIVPKSINSTQLIFTNLTLYFCDGSSDCMSKSYLPMSYVNRTGYISTL